MVSIKDFTARLGNQLFQIANAISYADRTGDVVAFPRWEYSKYFRGDFTPSVDTNMNKMIWEEPGFHYTPIPGGANLLGGYYQSEKYFLQVEDKIRNYFSFSDDTIKEVLNKNKEVLNSGRPTVSMHLRRGDYLKWPNHHPVLTPSYFSDAKKIFPPDSVFVVFSDDIQWCRDNFPEGEYIFIDGQSDVEDLCLMSMCTHNCIANSTFSWWGAWLNPNKDKIVVAPEKWFGPAYSHFITRDIYCEGWKLV